MSIRRWSSGILLVGLAVLPIHATQAQNSPIEKAIPAQGNTTLGFTKVCNGPDFVLTITGDGPFNINGYGPGIIDYGVFAGTSLTFPGPGNWLNIQIDELGGDHEHFNVGDMICPALPNNSLGVDKMWCDPTDNTLYVNFMPYDSPLLIEGNYTGLPYVMALGSIVLFRGGPTIFTGITAHELSGDYETITLPDVACGVNVAALQARMSCSGTTLQVDILSGDGPFQVVNSSGYYLAVSGLGTHLLPDYVAQYGPMTGIYVRERTGNYERLDLGDITTCDATPEEEEAVVVSPLPDFVLARVMEMPANGQHTVYDQPGGEPIRNPDNSLLTLPHDADGSGSDTFIVLDAQLYEGEVWLGLYLGGPNLGWVSQADLYPSAE